MLKAMNHRMNGIRVKFLNHLVQTRSSMSPYVCTFQFWWEELMRAQFHHGNCTNWSRVGALFVAVERSFVVRNCDKVRRLTKKEYHATLPSNRDC